MNKKIIIIFIVIIIGIIINFFKQEKKPIIIDQENTMQEGENFSIIYVQICGEVVKPGVYEMSSDDRIHDLIILAGGFTSNADSNSVNLVQKLVDGMKITVLAKKEFPNKISINKATINELKTLDGIGDVKAKAIVEYREINGPYFKIEDLVIFNIINENDFNKIKNDICL